MVDFAALRARLAVATQSSAPAIQIPTPAVAQKEEEKIPAAAPIQSKLPSSSKLGFELQEKVASLEQAILERHPRMPVLLREIHTALRAQPENVTLMSEEEIGVIVDGLKIQTGVEFASSITKTSSTKSLNSKIKSLGIGAF